MTMSCNLNNALKVGFTALMLFSSTTLAKAEQSSPALPLKAVADTYANIAHATYQDALTSAQSLKKTIATFLASPTTKTQQAAKDAWKTARIPYQQTEVFRFGNKLIDDWEGKVNAWPLDEGLIDYVDTTQYGTENEENPLFTANIIANKILKISGKQIDATTITPKLLESLQEAGGVEANVATGYHAIEFLLWGQDLHGTKAGAGERPASDYDLKNCTNGHCDRRGAYLRAVTDLLVSDLTYAASLWTKDGKARAFVMQNDGATGVKALLTGMGSLSYGEMAGDRIKLGLMLHDPEEEHDCFSDNTHNAHYYDAIGMKNVYTGRYQRLDRSVIKGASLADLMKNSNPKVNTDLLARINETIAAIEVIVKRAQGGEAYDQMIGAGNKAGNAVIQKIVDALGAQTKAIERVLAALNIKGVTMVQ